MDCDVHVILVPSLLGTTAAILKIVGICVGTVIAVFALIGVCYIMYRKTRGQANATVENDDADSMPLQEQSTKL